MRGRLASIVTLSCIAVATSSVTAPGGERLTLFKLVALSNRALQSCSPELFCRTAFYRIRLPHCAEEVGETTNLQEQLRLAIEEERYEDAAKIRDAIKAQPQSSGGGSRGRVDEEVSGGREEASDVRERLRQQEISRLRDIDPGGDNMGTPF